ncbi:MAG: hypothetical protein LVQ95_02515 [Candidatus Micrarchaeales archaeon]|nr:hypothetical protein [Candidatus Micrarchaeales archaeon]
MHQNKKNIVKEIAGERIALLFGLATRTIGSDREQSGRYIKRMRYMSSHYKVPLPKKIRNGICKKCNEVLVPGLNASVRIVSSKGYVATRCTKCGNEVHVHY